MELQLFISKDSASHLYYSDKSAKKNVINVKNLCIVFSGLPNFIGKEFFERYVDKDTAFMLIYYPGTWLSGGKFTINNCRKTIKKAIEFAQSKNGLKTFDGKRFNWNYKNLYIIGYSFAGNPILTTNINNKNVKAVLLYAPLIYLSKKDIENILNPEEAKKLFEFNKFFLKFLQRGYVHALRGIKDNSWLKYFSGNDLSSQININSNYPKIFIYHGFRDDQANPLFSKYFYKTHKNLSKLYLVKNKGHDKRMFKLRHLKI
jgi:hypothetical protein